MKTKRILIIGAIAALSLSGWIKSGWAAESKINYTFEPIYRNAMVSGDKEKFREDMWIKDGGAGGVQEFSLSQNLKGMKVEADAHAIVDEDDYNFNANLEKEDLFEITSGYKEFRKYYDGTGGYYGWFNIRKFIELDRDLQLNDGKFFVDLKSNRPGETNYFINYERHAKTGQISTLHWASVVDTIDGVAATRKIAPSWEAIDEVEHAVKLGAEGDTALSKNIHWKAEQQFLFLKDNAVGEERKYGSTATQNAIDSQNDRIKSNSAITTLLADNRVNDWLHVSSAARYEHTHKAMLEDFRERDATGLGIAVGTLNYFNETTSSTLDVYSWTGSLLMNPLKYLSASAKIKAELKKRFSDSATPQDVSQPPDYIPDRVTNVDSEDTYKSVDESLGVRFTKLPRTTLYIDGDFEQVYGRLRQSSVRWLGNSLFYRDVDIIKYRNYATGGISWRPSNILSVSSQYRKSFIKDNYSDRSRTPFTATTVYLDLLDEQKFDNDTFTTKIDIKPYKWIHGMFKYGLRNNNTFTTPKDTTSAKATQYINTYLTSVTLIPTQNFYLTGMFSRQSSFTDTQARLSTVAVIPRYKADVNTAMGSATYIITPKASFEAQYQWVHSDDFNNYSSFGMPFGLANTWKRLGLTFRYEIKEDLSTEILYGWTKYDENDNAGIDNYEANIIGGKIAYIF